MAARNGGAARWILIALACLLLTAMLCCGGGGVLLYLSPSLLLSWFLQDEPLSAPTVPASPEIAQELAQRLQGEDTARITGAELTQLATAGADEELAVFWVDFEGERFEVLLSAEIREEGGPAEYVNIQAEGELVVERGWFNHLALDRFDLGPLELGPYLVGQELTDDANRSLADQRAQRPQVGEMLDQIERMEVRDSALELTLAPGGFETWARLRQR